MFDSFYISFLNYLKPKFGRKSITFGLHYVSLIEISFYTLLGCFFAAFARQLNIGKITSSKAITLVVICVLFIYLKNWMRYNGKRRNILNAKSKKHKLQIWKLVIIPLVFITLSVVFYNAI